MRCYNCGCRLSEHSFCTNCGADVGLYKKIIRTSNYFYNEGLEHARVRDLSGAVVSLRESLKFNKNNIKARNLLGLVYYEMGEVPAALSEWVISNNLRNDKNVASDYINRVQSNAGELDNISQSIKKYNAALECLERPDGVDMAIIQLRASLKANKKFIRAHQLLALCLIHTEHLEAAIKELDKVRAIDINNTTALRYLNEINLLLHPENDKKKAKELKSEEGDSAETVSYMDGNELIIKRVGVKEKKGSNTVLNIIFGIAIGFAITFCLVLPARIQQEKSSAQEEIKAIGAELDEKNLTINELESTVSKQDDNIETLTKSLSAYAGTEGTLQSMESLLKAASIYLNNPADFLEVADYIKEVDESTWTDETSENYIALYKALKSAIGPSVCTAYVEDGIKAYNESQFTDAVAYFESAVFFDETSDNALYRLALSYEALERTEDAKTTYAKVVELFPNTANARRAEKALTKLGASSD